MKQFPLKEAIKKFYETEPLQTDLVRSVTAKMHIQPVTSGIDKWLFYLLAIFAFAGIIYCFTLFSQLPLLWMLLVVAIIGVFIFLSFKEQTMMFKRMTRLEG